MGKMIAAILRAMAFQLAQRNIARLRHPLDHPEIAPGFVLSPRSSSGNAADPADPWSNHPFVVVNLSVLESLCL